MGGSLVGQYCSVLKKRPDFMCENVFIKFSTGFKCW
jgi:hypothetical protein